MTHTITIPLKKVSLENELPKILSALDAALTSQGIRTASLVKEQKKMGVETGQPVAEFAPKEEQLKGGWTPPIRNMLEGIFKTDLGAKQRELGDLRVNLDDPAKEFRDMYISYFNKLITSIIKKEPGDTEKELINSRFVLLREILIRLITVALSSDMTPDRDGDAIVAVIRVFMKTINKSDLLEDKRLASSLTSFFSSRDVEKFVVAMNTTHNSWIDSLNSMVQSIKMMRANTKAFNDTLAYLEATKKTIMRQLIAFLNPKIKSDLYADNWIIDTLKDCQNEICTHAKETKDKALVKKGDAADEITQQQQIVAILSNAKKNKDPNHVEKIKNLFKLLNRTNLILKVVNCIDLLSINTGWILILTGALKIENLLNLIEGHWKECNILKLKEDDALFKEKQSSEALRRYSAVSNSALEPIARKSFNSIALLDNTEVSQRLMAFIQDKIIQLNLLQQHLRKNEQLLGDNVLQILNHDLPKLGSHLSAPQSSSSGVKIPLQAQNIPGTSIPEQPISILEGVLPCGRQMLFEEAQAEGDGMCGFHVLGFTREEVVAILMEYENDDQTREDLGQEIINEFRARITSGNPKDEKDIQHIDDKAVPLFAKYKKLEAELATLQSKALKGVAKFDPKIGVKDLLTFLKENLLKNKDFGNYRTQLIAVEEKITKNEQEITQHCNSKIVFKNYVKRYLGGIGLMGYQSALLLARKKEFHLYIWHKDPSQTKVNCVTHYIVPNAPLVHPTRHMLHTDGFNHFNFLIEYVKPKPSAVPAKKPSTQYSGIEYKFSKLGENIKALDQAKEVLEDSEELVSLVDKIKKEQSQIEEESKVSEKAMALVLLTFDLDDDSELNIGNNPDFTFGPGRNGRLIPDSALHMLKSCPIGDISDKRKNEVAKSLASEYYHGGRGRLWQGPLMETGIYKVVGFFRTFNTHKRVFSVPALEGRNARVLNQEITVITTEVMAKHGLA